MRNLTSIIIRNEHTFMSIQLIMKSKRVLENRCSDDNDERDHERQVILVWEEGTIP